jgi:glycosyltransferase involved in cell wall biosynthesis
MKIAIVAWDLSIGGGGMRQILELADYLVNKKHNVKIYCGYLNKDNPYPDLTRNLDIYSLYGQNYALYHNLFKRFFYPLKPLFLKEVKQIINLMDKDFDIVNCHDVYWVGYIYKQKYGGRVVWMMNDFVTTLEIPKISRNIKSLLKFFLFPIRGGIIGRYLDKKCITKADRIVVLDERNRNLLKENTGLDANIIRSGLNIENFKFYKRKINLKKNEVRILTTGIFYPHRRFEDLIIALSILRKKGYCVELNLIGSHACSKAYANKIRKLVSNLNLTRHVNLLGAVSENELIENYSSADVFVFPNYPQTWGLAVFEAMACGTPVIVSTGAGASEVLTDGENALLVPPERPEEIAVCLQKLLNDEKLWERLSINGRKFVEENIRWDLYGEKMLQLFSEVLSNYSHNNKGENVC